MTYQIIVLLLGFVLMTLMVVRGASIFVAAPVCAAAILALSGFDPAAGLAGPFMKGFADYAQRFYFIFTLGALFGRLMETSGAADSIARAVVRWLGVRWACLSVVLACAVLTYGGVSLFVVGFSVYPLAVQLFRQADLPRRFIPGAIAFGSITFTMTSAGSPEIQNLIPIRYLLDAKTNEPLSDAMAGWPVSLIVAAVMFGLGQLYLEWAIARDHRAGGRFESRPSDPEVQTGENLPDWRLAALPLILTLLSLNLLPLVGEHLTGTADKEQQGPLVSGLLRFREDPALAILVGVLTAIAVLRRRKGSLGKDAGEGFVNGLIALGCTCSVVGFGSALSGLPAFQRLVAWVTHLPGDPLVNAALAVAVIAGIAGSASGGQSLALPLIKPIFIDQLGIAPRALHRVVAIASGSLDSLPANGYLVMLIRTMCNESYSQAYGPIFVLSVLIPILGTTLAIAMFKLVPSWGWM